MKKKLIILSIFVVALAGTGGYVLGRRWFADAFNRNLVAAAHRSDAVSLCNLTTEPWERVYLFDCYAAPAQVNTSLGFAYSDSNVEVNQSSEGVNLLLFVAGGRVVVSVLHPRFPVDFYPYAVGYSYTPEDAVFIAERSHEDARLLLRPVHSPTQKRLTIRSSEQKLAAGFCLHSTSCLASLCR